MVDLSKKRIDSWPDRAHVVQIDGSLPLPAADGSADRFVASYVPDLLPHHYAQQIIDNAHRILAPDGLTCLASLTSGKSRLALSPRAGSAYWTLESATNIQSWGAPSQLVVASAR